MITKAISATGLFKVTVDETKFTPEFMEEFNANFHYCEGVNDHIEHLAQLFARGVIDGSTDFIEGYGPPADFGIKFEADRGSKFWIDVPVEIAMFDPVPA